MCFFFSLNKLLLIISIEIATHSLIFETIQHIIVYLSTLNRLVNHSVSFELRHKLWLPCSAMAGIKYGIQFVVELGILNQSWSPSDSSGILFKLTEHRVSLMWRINLVGIIRFRNSNSFDSNIYANQFHWACTRVQIYAIQYEVQYYTIFLVVFCIPKICDDLSIAKVFSTHG